MPELVSVEIAALGVPVRIDVLGDDADRFIAAVKKAWHLCREVPEGPRATILVDRLSLTADTSADVSSYNELIPAVEFDAALQQLTQAVTHCAIQRRAGGLLMAHAAGLAHPHTGDAVALVAAGGTGKTTACRKLGPRWSYLTDETVAVDRNDLVVPYPKPLSLRLPGTHIKAETAPGELGLRLCPVPATLRAIVVLRRNADWTDPPEITELSTLDAMVAIAPETSSLARLPQPLHYLHDLFQRLRLVAKVTYSDVETLAPLLTELIGPPVGGDR